MSGDWQIKKLRDVCTLINGRAYSKSELLSEGKYPVLRVGNFFTNNNWYYSNFELPPEKYCEPGDLLYAWSASFGPRIWEGDKVIFHYHIWKVQPEVELIDQRYLFYFFEWDTEQIKLDQGTGTTMIHVAKGSMEDRDVPVPSLSTQRRIVAILDEAFEGIATAKANAEKNLQNARELCEELIQGLFPEDGSIRVDAPSLDSLCELIVDCEHKTAPTQEHGIPSIRTPNIGRGRLLLEGVYRVSDEIYKEWSRRAEPQGGDLILAREAPAGNVAVIPGGMKVCLGQRTVLIRPKNDILEPDYLAQLLLRRNSQRRLLAHSRGATVQHINLKDIRAFKISAIPPLTEQRHLVEQVNELLEVEDRLVEIYERKLTALDKLKKSLLHQAFSGQL